MAFEVFGQPTTPRADVPIAPEEQDAATPAPETQPAPAPEVEPAPAPETAAAEAPTPTQQAVQPNFGADDVFLGGLEREFLPFQEQSVQNLQRITDITDLSSAVSNLDTRISEIRRRFGQQLMDPGSREAQLLQRLEQVRNTYNTELQRRQQAAQQTEQAVMPSTQELEGLLALAEGEGVENLPSIRQLDASLTAAQDQIADVFASPTGQTDPRSQQMALARRQRLTAEGQQQREVLMALERAMALSAADDLSQNIQAQLTEDALQNEQFAMFLDDLATRQAQVQLDLETDLGNAQLLSEAQIRAQQEAAEEAWKRALVGAGVGLVGTAIGASFGGG